MPPRLPNLFRDDPKNASRYYQMFLGRLEMQDRYEDVVAMCRRIRRLATPEYDRRYLQVFYLMEIDALAQLGRYRSAWRQLRDSERVRWGRKLDLETRRWRLQDIPILTMDYAPLLYFLGRYDLGRQLLEKAIRIMLNRHSRFYEALMSVTHGVRATPSSTYTVRLAHFYDALGKDLRQWKGWERLIDALHPQLFVIGGMSRSELKDDATLVHEFVGRLVDEQNRRGCVVNRGQADLIEAPEQVRAAQNEDARKMKDFTERTAQRRLATEAKIQQLFGAFLEPHQ